MFEDVRNANKISFIRGGGIDLHQINLKVGTYFCDKTNK